MRAFFDSSLTGPSSPPVLVSNEPGPYSVVAPSFTFYFTAFMDSNGNGEYDSIEPYGVYGAPDPVTVNPGINTPNIDITLISALLRKYAPVLYFHPDEQYYPWGIESMLDKAGLWKETVITSTTSIWGEFLDTVSSGDLYKYDSAFPTYFYLDLKGYTPYFNVPSKQVWQGYPLKVYGRQFEPPGYPDRIILQYWFFYPFNDWDTGTFFLGKKIPGNDHEGDWEMIQISYFKIPEKPGVLVTSHHNSTSSYDWDTEVSKTQQTHPKIFIGKGGHGNWATSGDHNVGKINPLKDLTSENGTVLLPNQYTLVDITSEPSWVNWIGLWGDRNQIWGSKGPESPGQHEQWEDPIKWAEKSGSFITGLFGSPGHLHVYDSYGNHVGLTETDDIETNIPGTYFYVPSSYSDSSIEVVWINTSEDVRFVIEGTGSGSFNFTFNRYLEEENLSLGVTYENVEITQNTIATVNVSPQNPGFIMEIDLDGDGIVDETKNPDTIEGAPPVSNGTILINNGAKYTRSRNVTLTLDADNAVEMSFSNNNPTWSAWEAYATTKSWTLTSGNGQKTVYVKFKDAGGIESDTYSDTIILDTTAPTGSISINNGAAYTNSRFVTLALSAIGAATMCFSNDNSSWSSWENCATSKSWTLTSGDGTRRVYARFKDAAGNVSETYSDTIIYDTTPPNVTISSPKSNTYVGGTLNIIGSAADTHFRGYELYYRQGESPSSWNLIKESSSAVDNSILGSWDTTKVTDGTYTLKLWADDKANNSAETKVKIFIDNTPPEIENLALDQENFIPGDYASSTPTILATLTDTGSGIDETTIDLRIKPAEGDEIVVPASSVSFNSETGEMSYTVTEPLADSEYTVSINVKDKVGNSAEEKATEFVIESELAMKKVLNYPNPFSSDTKFTYHLTRDVDEVTIKVYTVAGELVKTIDFASSHVGYNEEEWDGINDYGEEVANGTYVYKITVKFGDEKVSKVQMLTVLK